MYFFHIITTFILCISLQNNCMEPAIVEKKQEIVLFDRQQKVMLHLDDGNNFSIEKCKVYQSEALYKDYLRRQKSCKGEVKNMSLLFSNMNLEEMQLYSGVCDVEPQDLKKHFNALSPAQQKILFVVAGEHGKNPGEKKLNDSNLNAKLWELLLERDLKKDFFDSNIKCRMEQSDWMDCCTNEMAKDNISWILPERPFADSLVTKYANEGYLYTVPSRLLGGSYDGPLTTILTTNNSEEFTTAYIKDLKDSFQYRITQRFCVSDENKKDNEVLLWLVNSLTNCGKSIPMPRFECSIIMPQLSGEDKFLLTWSKKEARLTRMVRKEDDQFSANHFIIPTAANIIDATFNKQATVIALSCWDQQGTCALWDISSNNCVKKFEQDFGLVGYLVFNDEGDRLCIVSIKDERKTVITFLDTSDLSAISVIRMFESEEEGFTLKVVCSPTGRQWAFVDYNRQMIFIDEINGEFVMYEKPLPDLLFDPKKSPRVKMVYSPDSRFIAALYPAKGRRRPRIALYNAFTYEELGTWSRNAEGLGFTANSKELIFQDDEGFCYKIDLFPETDHKALGDLSSNACMLQLALLRRLYRAHANNDMLELYEEGLAYKSWLLLPKEQRKFIEKCFPVMKVINNNKDLSETYKDVADMADAWLENSKKSFLGWWDDMKK